MLILFAHFSNDTVVATRVSLTRSKFITVNDVPETAYGFCSLEKMIMHKIPAATD